MKLVSAAAAAAMILVASHSAVGAVPPPPPVVLSKTPVAVQVGAWGVIGVAATLGLYDIIRRVSCNDFIGLGGPGFSQPMRATDNALVPQNCAPRRR